MLSLIYMKILESSPRRYDRGMALLTLGAASRTLRSLLKTSVHEGDRVLDIGCGTGEAAKAAAALGAHVLAFDISKPMIAVARDRGLEAGSRGEIEYKVMGVASMDTLADASVDVAVAAMSMSEFSAAEQAHVLRHARRILRKGGRLIITDEVRPDRVLPALVHYALRLPLLIAVFIISQETTKPINGLISAIEAAGFETAEVKRSTLRNFMGVRAVRREDR